MRVTLRSRTASGSAPLARAARSASCCRAIPGMRRSFPAFTCATASRPPNQSVMTSPSKPQSSRRTRGQERGALRRVGAVHLVVGGHHRPRSRLLHHDLEAPEVDLAQRARGDPHVDHVAVPLVVVGDEVLHRRPDPLGLHAVHHGRRHPARQERVLRVVLEVPPAERVAVDVERGPEEHVDAVLLRLVAHGAAHALHEVGVPRRGEERLDRERGAEVRARRVPFALRLDPEAGGAVGDDDRGDSEPADGDRRSRGAGNALRGLADDRPLSVRRQPGTPHAGADDEADLLLARHRGDDVLRGALAELRQVGRQLRRRRPPPESPAPEAPVGIASRSCCPLFRAPPSPSEGGPSGRTLPRRGRPRHGPFGERIRAGEECTERRCGDVEALHPGLPLSSLRRGGRGTSRRARVRARLGRPGRRHLPQPRPEGRLLRPRRDPRRRGLLPRRVGLPFRRNAGAALARSRELGGRRPGLPAARRAPEVRRDERLRPGHLGAHAAIPRRALLRVRAARRTTASSCGTQRTRAGPGRRR